MNQISSLPFLRPFLLLWALFLLLTACNQAQSTPTDSQNGSQTLLIFAAASLTDAFNEMGQAFTAEHNTVVTFNFAGSSQLATQLLEGANADVFASANHNQMQNAIDGGRINAATAVPFASNRLTVVVPADNPAHISRLEDLANPGILIVTAVEGVPVRQYTDAIVAKLGPEFSAAFYANIVSEEDNVRQLLAKIALGEADAGLVYTSDITPDVADQLLPIPIPDAQNETAVYPIAPIADSANPVLAQQFVDFVGSQAGQAILQKWGFAPPVE